MRELSRSDLASRLAFDHRVVQALHAPSVARIEAFGSREEMRVGRTIEPERAARGEALFYVVTTGFPILVSPGKSVVGTRVLFDLMVPGRMYPFAAPFVSVVTRPVPFSPHVHPAAGNVCLGSGFTAACGRMLLAQLIVHVLRLLNCDEPDPGVGYDGWNAAAVSYWRTTMGRRPLHPDLVYPTLPAELTHGLTAPDVNGVFVPVPTDAILFRPQAEPVHGEPDTVFHPVTETLRWT